MGLLEKYLAYRWLSGGLGRRKNDASNGVVLLMSVLMFLFGVLFALQALLDIVYQSVRSVLLVAPYVSSVAGGVLLAVVLTIPAQYSPDTAREIFAPTGARDGNKFYLRALAIAFLINVWFLLVVLLDGQLPSDWIRGVVDHPLAHLTGNLGFVIFFFYMLYKLFHLPYRYHRLLQFVPNGSVYTFVYTLPITVLLIPAVFDLPVLGSTEGGSGPLGWVLAFAYVNIPLLLPLVLIKYRAESHILEQIGQTQ